MNNLAGSWKNWNLLPLQVTGLAFNPFKTLDDKNIVGSIGNVQLSSAYQSIRVHDLIEDIEVQVSMETGRAGIEDGNKYLYGNRPCWDTGWEDTTTWHFQYMSE